MSNKTNISKEDAIKTLFDEMNKEGMLEEKVSQNDLLIQIKKLETEVAILKEIILCAMTKETATKNNKKMLND
jgi:restriction endonuclease